MSYVDHGFIHFMRSGGAYFVVLVVSFLLYIKEALGRVRNIEVYFFIPCASSSSMVVSYILLHDNGPWIRVNASYFLCGVLTVLAFLLARQRGRIAVELEHRKVEIVKIALISIFIYELDLSYSVFYYVECVGRCLIIANIFGDQTKMNIISFISLSYLSAAVAKFMFITTNKVEYFRNWK